MAAGVIAFVVFDLGQDGFFARVAGDEADMAGGIQEGVGECDAPHGELRDVIFNDEAGVLVEGRGARKEGSRVPVGSHAKENQIMAEDGVNAREEGEPVLVFAGSEGRGDFTLDAKGLGCLIAEGIEEGFLDHVKVALAVGGRHTAFVSECENPFAPVLPGGGQGGVNGFRGIAAAE